MGEDARATATLRGVEHRCDFWVGDMSHLDLQEATVIFMYLPVAALTHLMRNMLPKAGIQQGTVVITADGPFPSKSAHLLTRLNARAQWWEKHGLHCYSWQASAE